MIWQEGVSPFLVVELLSPGTETEDLGNQAELTELADEALVSVEPNLETRTAEGEDIKPPRKWEVYEQILRVPYYIVLSRYTNQLRFFQLVGGRYQEQALKTQQPQIWIPELDLGIGLWNGTYEGVERLWLRWYNANGWILTDTERADRLAARLRELGEDPDALV